MAISNNLCAPVQEYVISSQRLVIPFAIVANATPANKSQSNGLGAAMILALQGQTAAAAAIDSGTNFTSPSDSSGTFGILLYNLGQVLALQDFNVKSLASGVLTAQTVTAVGSSNTGVTASLNIALSVSGASSLATTSFNGYVSVDYQVSSTLLNAG